MAETTSNIKNMVDKLLANGQLILTGAPGTGKTYTAQQIAACLILGMESELNGNDKKDMEILKSASKEMKKNSEEYQQLLSENLKQPKNICTDLQNLMQELKKCIVEQDINGQTCLKDPRNQKTYDQMKKCYKFIDYAAKQVSDDIVQKRQAISDELNKIKNWIHSEDLAALFRSSVLDLDKYVPLCNKIDKVVNDFSSFFNENNDFYLRFCTSDERTTIDNRKKTIIQYHQFSFVQFHPGYSYSDFVEGLKPVTSSSGNVSFVRQDGVFMEFCKNANRLNQFLEVFDQKEKGDQKNDVFDFDIVFNDFISWQKTKENSGKYECELTTDDGSKKTYYVTIVENAEKEEVLNFYESSQNKNSTAITIKKKNQSCSWERLLTTLRSPHPRFDYWHLFEPLYKEPSIIQKILPCTQKVATLYVAVDKKMLELVKEKLDASLEKTVSHKHFSKKLVFIIDEINRADLSRVFGELMFGLEKEYRGQPVETQYSYMRGPNEPKFVIPENVYIIGTMNDIDRSVESMDFALRRRFAWHEITAEDSMAILECFKKDQSLFDKAKKKMKAINQYIGPWKDIKNSPLPLTVNGKTVSLNLGKEYQLGGAYFKKIDNYPKNK